MGTPPPVVARPRSHPPPMPTQPTTPARLVARRVQAMTALIMTAIVLAGSALVAGTLALILRADTRQVDPPRMEVHTIGLGGHVLCNQAGLDAIRSVAAKPEPSAPWEFEPQASYFSGWPIYVDTCPCSRVSA